MRDTHWIFLSATLSQARTLALGLALVLGVSLATMAQSSPPEPSHPIPPAPPSLQTSPVQFFRKLLAMDEPQREAALTNRSPAQRKILIQKLHEYDLLPPEAREIRLRQTELRWYVQTLIKIPSSDRATRLDQVPETDRPLIVERLRQWDELPADVQKQFLDNQEAVSAYLERKTSPVSTPLPAPTARQIQLDREMKHLENLPQDQRQKMCDLFQKFFDLDPRQKQKTLGVLTESERLQIEHNVSSYTHLPPDQRTQRISSFKRLVTMAPEDRETFLKNAAQWQRLSPKERELWRHLVSKLPPMPPTPPGLKVKAAQLPPIPPLPQ
jgi:Spy/CpxP family protein refolding chaperone